MAVRVYYCCLPLLSSSLLKQIVSFWLIVDTGCSGNIHMLLQLIEVVALIGELLLEGLESARIDWLLSDLTISAEYMGYDYILFLLLMLDVDCFVRSFTARERVPVRCCNYHSVQGLWHDVIRFLLLSICPLKTPQQTRSIQRNIS